MNRDAFLKRVRDALGHNANTPPSRPPAPPLSTAAPRDIKALVARFKERNELVLGRVWVVDTLEQGRARLTELLEGTRTYCRTSHPILNDLRLEELVRDKFLAEPKDADVGISGAEFAVAETGTVALSSTHGRLVTLLPYHHVVVLRAAQILPDLEDLYGTLDQLELPSAFGMHSGPSKSADIEQTMALGVHGPGKVDIVVIHEA
ncbi:MAG: LUD domain-containing protein [Pleurocapsa sp. SU_196_0]|nr:LUD domain-containing protein [Pleurocapsa sp. SU_196_0]